MVELFGIVIVVAVLFGVFCAWGPKAMLATIAAPSLLVVAFVAYVVLKPTEVYVDTSLKNNPFSDQYVNNPADWVTDAELAKSKSQGLGMSLVVPVALLATLALGFFARPSFEASLRRSRELERAEEDADEKQLCEDTTAVHGCRSQEEVDEILRRWGTRNRR